MAKPPVGAPQHDEAGDGFLSRWSRRKAQVRQGASPPEPAVLPAVVPVVVPAALAVPALPVAAAQPAPSAVAEAAPEPAAPPEAPTLADVAALTRESDYARFVAPGVDSGIKNAALKKLFTDPHFNIMDRLDTYIDDYGQPDPLPEGMLRQMAQSQFLGLFTDDEDKPATGDPPTRLATDPSLALTADPTPDLPSNPPSDPTLAPDEDPDLRLQPHPATGPRRPEPGAEPDAGRQH